ncbi:hypothetical protein DFJ73DRAFT_851455 [Zopfochytrium polystomum]|nr:hypothetical protein DFJ73DRAFT_851455 [Zopfochytrium polystomum]
MHPAPCLAFLSGFDFFNLTTPALDGPKLNDDENSKSARKLRSCFRAAAAALPAHPRLYNISRFCEHEILPVVDGLRVTLTFNLHRVTEAEEDAANDVPAPSVDMPGSSVESFLKQLLSDPLFMPDGGELGFALAHEYSKAVGGGLHLKLADLKGEDYLLTSAVKSAGLEFEVAAIYEADWEDDGEEKQQGYGPYSIEPNGYNFGSSVRINCCGDGAVLLVGPNFAARCEWMGGQKRELYDILTRDANCEVLKDLVWVRRPKAFTIRASSFAAYGNEATLVDIYATAALIVTIPGKRMLQSVED